MTNTATAEALMEAVTPDDWGTVVKLEERAITVAEAQRPIRVPVESASRRPAFTMTLIDDDGEGQARDEHRRRYQHCHQQPGGIDDFAGRAAARDQGSPSLVTA